VIGRVDGLVTSDEEARKLMLNIDKRGEAGSRW
jgi:hypothetical protein